LRKKKDTIVTLHFIIRTNSHITSECLSTVCKMALKYTATQKGRLKETP